MRIAIVHDRVSADDAPDARDVLEQAAAVAGALTALGHDVARFACTLDLEALRGELLDWQPHTVFNLVESIGGQGRLIHLPLFMLDAAGLPYTGASATAMLLTSHKIMAKRTMAAAGIATPQWVGPFPLDVYGGALSGTPGDWIVKSLWEHASIGLDAGSIIYDASPENAFAALPERAPRLGGACFAEHYIAGREFNLAVLAGPDGPQVLPPAEIIFDGYGSEMPRIVDYAAKWEADTFAYHHTPRRFEIDETDRSLVDGLKASAISCWNAFGLNGYARVDFRVAENGQPWVLEVNANPCLAPDAGYAAALTQAGITFTEAVRRIIDDVPDA
ncbi:MAG: D-alanine--D-alanine ligase [Pseudomonadota bacterium]